MWNLKNQTKTSSQVQRTDWWLLEVVVGWEEWVKGVKSYKINKLWEFNVQHGDYS